MKERGRVFSDDGPRAAIDSLCRHIVETKSKSFTTHYALRVTAEVSAEEARANMKRLERGLVKNADKRREFYLRYSRPVTLQTSTVCGVLYLVLSSSSLLVLVKGKKGTEGPELGQTRPHLCCLCWICPNPPLFISFIHEVP